MEAFGMPDLRFLSGRALVRLIGTKKLSPLELMEETLRRIDAVNPILNAFISIRAEEALSEARLMTEQLTSSKKLRPLQGIPIGVKDLEDVKGMVTSFGSVPYKNNVAQNDSIQVARWVKRGLSCCRCRGHGSRGHRLRCGRLYPHPGLILGVLRFKDILRQDSERPARSLANTSALVHGTVDEDS
jgi:hypothetical protein